MPQVLLTGATGFIGRQVLRSLLDAGADVRAVVRPRQPDRPDLPEGVEITETKDLFAEDRHWWQRTLRDIDTVIHVAWYAEPGKYLESPLNLSCLTGTIELAHGAVLAGVRRFVGIGTCFEYDLSAHVLTVETPLRPSSLYAACKASVWNTLSAWLPKAGISFAWCRPFYLYGEGEDSRRLVPYIRNRLEKGEPVPLDEGLLIRDYIDVREAGRAIAGVALSDAEGPFNICTGIPITIRQLAERIADEYGRRDLLQFGALPPRENEPPCIVGVPNYRDI